MSRWSFGTVYPRRMNVTDSTRNLSSTRDLTVLGYGTVVYILSKFWRCLKTILKLAEYKFVVRRSSLLSYCTIFKQFRVVAIIDYLPPA